MKAKLKFVIPILLLLVAGGGYRFATAKPSKAAPKPKVAGMIYVMPKEFLVNLADGRYAKLSVALELGHGAIPAAKDHGSPTPPEGYGPLPQEALVRSLITDALTSADAEELFSKEERKHLKERVLKAIEKKTDVKAHAVLFPDVTVQ